MEIKLKTKMKFLLFVYHFEVMSKNIEMNYCIYSILRTLSPLLPWTPLILLPVIFCYPIFIFNLLVFISIFYIRPRFTINLFRFRVLKMGLTSRHYCIIL